MSQFEEARKATCEALQFGDQRFCKVCDLTWDINDQNPPLCQRKHPLARSVKIPKEIMNPEPSEFIQTVLKGKKKMEVKQPKFKKGQKIWHVTRGLLTILDVEFVISDYPLRIEFGDVVADSFTTDGKDQKNDIYPIIYTLEEARKRGFPGVPKEPFRLEQKVTWGKRNNAITPSWIKPEGVALHQDIMELLGKTGTLTFVEDSE